MSIMMNFSLIIEEEKKIYPEEQLKIKQPIDLEKMNNGPFLPILSGSIFSEPASSDFSKGTQDSIKTPFIVSETQIFRTTTY